VVVNDKRNRRDVWTIASKPFKGAHFAVMPEALVEPCVLAGSAEGDTVLDPFTGSGTVAVVALQHGRNFVGTELNPEYGEIAKDRITKAAPMFNQVEIV
jgi:DNA modification methylase